MKKILTAFLSLICIFTIVIPVFAETEEEAAKRIIADTSSYLCSQYGLADDTTINAEKAGKLYVLNTKDIWKMEEIMALSDLYDSECGYVYLVYGNEKPLTVMYLRKQSYGWELLSLGEDADQYTDAINDYMDRTHQNDPILLYSMRDRYLFDGSPNGYLRNSDGEYFEVESVVKHYSEYHRTNRHMYDENGRYLGAGIMGLPVDVLKTDELQPVEPVKQFDYTILLLGFLIVLIVGGIVLLNRKSKFQ